MRVSIRSTPPARRIESVDLSRLSGEFDVAVDDSEGVPKVVAHHARELFEPLVLRLQRAALCGALCDVPEHHRLSTEFPVSVGYLRDSDVVRHRL
jgi:hypothetical protein